MDKIGSKKMKGVGGKKRERMRIKGANDLS
jgi:hypothetical protein